MTAFVLGNGLSRKNIDIEYLKTCGKVYGCNALYRTYKPDVLVATDTPISQEIQNSGYSLEHEFFTRQPNKKLGAKKVPQKYYGFSSGPIAISLAAIDQHTPIYLLGFDMGPDETGRFNNIYADTQFYKPLGSPQTYTGNWVRQIGQIAQDFQLTEFIRVHGSTTAEIPELTSFKNIKNIDLDNFLSRINKFKGSNYGNNQEN